MSEADVRAHGMNNALTLTSASSHLQILKSDASGGQERVRIPVVNDTGDAVAPPVATYHADYTASPAAAAVINELYARKLVQWAGVEKTRGALPDFAGTAAVFFSNVGTLDKIQFTPCMEDAPGLGGPLHGCARLSAWFAV